MSAFVTEIKIDKKLKKLLFPKVKRLKKKSKTALTRQADKLFADKVKSVGCCQLVNLDKIRCTDTQQCMHIIGRANRRMRWDLKNALDGCSGHHMYYTNHPWEWVELIKRFFPARYQYINKHRNELWDGDIEAVIERL